MSFLKNIFKSKPGGTLVGNLLRSGAQIAKSAASAIPIVGPVLSKLPIGEGLMMKQPVAVQNQIVDSIMNAAVQPALERPQALQLASAAKQHITTITGDAALADKVGQATYEAAAAPKVHIDDLGKVLSEITTAVVTESPAPAAGSAAATTSQKESIKDIITGVAKGALQGAKEGAINAFTNTDTGKQLEKDTMKVYFEKYAPYLGVGLVAFLLWKNRK